MREREGGRLLEDQSAWWVSMRSCTVGHASNILPVVKVVSRGSLFPWYPSSLRTVNCTHSICKLIDHYCVFKNNCSLITIIKEGFGEPLAFYLHTHPLTVLPHWRNSFKRGKGECSTTGQLQTIYKWTICLGREEPGYSLVVGRRGAGPESPVQTEHWDLMRGQDWEVSASAKSFGQRQIAPGPTV